MKQLSVVSPEYTQQMLSRLEKIFLSHGFSAGGSRGSYLLYQCPQSEVETTALLADSIEKCDTFLRSRRKRWNGYSLYVFFDDLPEGRNVKLSQIAAEVHTLPEEDGIWLDERAARLLSDRFMIRTHDGTYRIVSGERKKRRDVLSFGDFFADLPIVEEAMDSFAPLLQSSGPACFLIRGSDPVCNAELAASLQRGLDGSMRRVYWLELSPVPGDHPAGAILLRAIDPGFCTLVPEHLRPHERRSWVRREELLDTSPDSVRYGDAMVLFTLYLTAYIRYMRTLLLPALMVCHQVEECSVEQQEILSGICRRFAMYESFLPLFTSPREIPEELSDGFTVGSYDCDAGLAGLREAGGMSREGGRDASSLFLLYSRTALQLTSSGKSSRGAFKAFFENLPEEHLFLLYALSHFGSVFPAELRGELAESLGMEQEEINLALRELAHYGLIEQDRELRLVFEEVIPPLGAFLGEKRDYLRKVCVALVPEVRTRVARQKREEFVKVALELGQEGPAAEVFTELLEETLFRSFDDRIIESVEALVRGAGGSAARLVSSELLETIRLEAHLRQGLHEEAQKRYRILFRDEEPAQGGLESGSPHRLIVAGEYLWRSRRPDEALPYAKRALLTIQDTDNVPRILQARILIGKVMLSLGRVDEALEYFRSAKGYKLSGPPAALDLASSSFIALTHFVLGDYSLALGYIRPAREKAARMGRRDWERYLLMLEGKLQFELGRYREASLLFQELLTGEILYFGDGRRNLFYAWLYRSLIYRGYIEEGIRRLEALEERPEVLLFIAEGYILDRDLESAATLVARAVSERASRQNLMMSAAEHLAPDGFDSFENYLFQGQGDNDLLLRHLKALHGFLAYNLGRSDEAEREFEEVLGDKGALNLDPYRHIYYFFRTLSFAEHRAEEEVQKLTLLSKAWQNLQKRAGRINDPEDRRSYLTENYWNSKLFAMSKEYKLV